MGSPYQLTSVGLFLPRYVFRVTYFFPLKDGVEAQFQTNHLGHFAFTIPLIPLLTKTSKVFDLCCVHWSSTLPDLVCLGSKDFSEGCQRDFKRCESLIFSRRLFHRILTRFQAIRMSTKMSDSTVLSLSIVTLVQ